MIHLAFDQAQFRPPVENRIRHLLRVSAADLQAYGRIGRVEAHQDRRQPVPADRLAGRQGERAALQFADLAQEKLRAFGARQRVDRFRQKSAAGIGQLDAPTGPVKQPDAITLFQPADRRADGRGRQMQRLGGLREMFALRHGDENAQLLQRHHLFDPIE